jgi:hypothetical protein
VHPGESFQLVVFRIGQSNRQMDISSILFKRKSDRR